MPSYITVSFEIEQDNPHVADAVFDMIWNEIEKLAPASPHIISYSEVERSYGTRYCDDFDDDDLDFSRRRRRRR